MKKLEGKVAIITGASRGVGAYMAREFAKEGCDVVVPRTQGCCGALSVRGSGRLKYTLRGMALDMLFASTAAGFAGQEVLAVCRSDGMTAWAAAGVAVMGDDGAPGAVV